MAVIDDRGIVIACWPVRIEGGNRLVVGGRESVDIVFMHQRVIRRDANLAPIGKLPVSDSSCRMVERMALRHDDR